MDTEILEIADYIFYAIVVICAIVGNSLVITSVVKFEYLRSNANYFVTSLACSDLLMACTWPILQGINGWKKSTTEDDFHTWEISCKVAMTVQIFAILGDFMSIFAITMDRFVYINFPLRYETFVTKKRVFVTLNLMLITAIPFAGFIVWFPDRLVYGRSCSLWTVLDPLLINIMWTPLLMLVNAIFISVYFKVGYLAYKAKREIRIQQIVSSSAGNQTNSSGKSTASLMLVVGVFLSTYTIWLIIYYLTVDTYSDSVTLQQMLITWFWQTNIWVNPVIYAYKNRNFKRAFRKLLGRPSQNDL